MFRVWGSECRDGAVLHPVWGSCRQAAVCGAVGGGRIWRHNRDASASFHGQPGDLGGRPSRPASWIRCFSSACSGPCQRGRRRSGSGDRGHPGIDLIGVIHTACGGRPAPAGGLRAGLHLGLNTNDPWPRAIIVVPCTEQHVAEVFFAGNVWPQSLAYPGDNAVSRQANNRCDTAFDAYVGRPDHLVTFTDRAIYPGNTVWSSGDRLVLCVAYKVNLQSVDYSIKGSNG